MSEQNKALARKFYEEVFNQKNVAAIDDVCAPDFVDRNPMPGQAPGLAGMKATFGQFLKAFPDMHVTIEEMVAERDIVSVRLTVNATHKGEFMGAPATNTKMAFHGIDMFRITNGKVVEAYHYGDEMVGLMQIGVRMPA